MRVKLDEDAFLPERAHDLDAGYDLKSPIPFTIRKGESVTIDTGVHIEIPEGYVGFLKSKSGLNVKLGIICEGVIDSGYTGSIKVRLMNTGDRCVRFSRGNKLIQIVFLPIFTPDLELVEELEQTDRGNNGFGSTGR